MNCTVYLAYEGVSQKTRRHTALEKQCTKAIEFYDECLNYGKSAKECEYAVHIHSPIAELIQGSPVMNSGKLRCLSC